MVNLNELMDASVSLLRADLQQRARVEKNYHEPILVTANRNMAMRTVINLLVVAVRSFEQTSSGKNELRIKTSLDGDQAVIEISHNGKAVPAEVVSHLGDFYHLAMMGGVIPLNLGIADQLATSLLGTLTIVHPGEEGALFRLSLPVAEGDRQASLRDEPEHTEPHGNVLFIDDEKNQLRSYRRYFERYHQVYLAENADEALNALSVRQDFNAVVMDVLLPETEGLRLLRLVGANARVKDRLILLVPPGLTAGVRDQLRKSGHILLNKPVDMESLESVLAHITRA